MTADGLDGAPTLTRRGPVARVRLARAAHRNALRPTDLQVLLDHFSAVDADAGVRVVVLEADLAEAGRPVFCAGFDIAGFDDPAHDPRLFERVVESLEALRPITVCAVSGSVHGGAMDMVLACDLRVAVQGAVFRMPAVGLGLHYYPSGLARFVSRLGTDLAKRAFLGGRALSVEELQAAGAFDAVVSPEAFGEAVESLVLRVTALAPLAAQLTKRSLNELGIGVHDAVRLSDREARTLASGDFAEGRRAFAQDRRPEYTGN